MEIVSQLCAGLSSAGRGASHILGLLWTKMEENGPLNMAVFAHLGG